MPDHLIRLRGPWELLDPADPDGPEPTRIHLPADLLPVRSHPITLRRSFGRPARAPETTRCRLRCTDIPGWTRMTLNGRLLAERLDADAGSPGDGDEVEVPLPGPLPMRNLLEIRVMPAPSRSAPAGSVRPWGQIALVFSDSEDP